MRVVEDQAECDGGSVRRKKERKREEEGFVPVEIKIYLI